MLTNCINLYVYLKEIEDAVDAFALSLETTDQCAVLVLLSHGREGFIYGSDGNKVELCKLFGKLNNKNCKKMAGKPKLVIVQACQGGKLRIKSLLTCFNNSHTKRKGKCEIVAS